MRLAAPFIAAASLAACATAAPPERTAQAGEATIPFITRDGILEWIPASAESVYLRGSNGHWYLVRTMGPCRISSASALSFEASPGDRLDRHGAIRAEGFRCPIESIVRSEAPPQVRDKG